MDEFCLLYLLLLLLMRSGDVETNPGPKTAVSTVSEMEFLELAQDIPPSYYYNVGISLGFSYHQLQSILVGNLKNFKNAYMDVFMKWNVKQQPPPSNKRQLLADKLRAIDLGSLSDRLLNGPPIPNSTGGPSRLPNSQTKPLFPELVKQLAKDFKSSTVSELEFLMLAQAIPPSYYEAVGISLGFSSAQLEDILIQKANNYTNAFVHVSMISLGIPDVQLEKILNEKSNYTEAFFDVFMKWNIKQLSQHSNKRQLLADKLREFDFGGLSDRLLNESLIPISTGGPSRLSESQTKPLSPELVERCANDFKFKYRSTLCKIRADPLNPASTVQFEDLHTNLVLLEEHGTEKRMLDYNDILDLKVNGEFPKRIMVQGEAGAGKTTLCAKIAWDWTEGRHFSHFVWVLIVPLREFKQHTIGEIAKSYLAKNNPATVSQITEYIRSNPDKVFIAFDGLDEVSGKIMKTESWESRPTYQMQPQPSQLSVTSDACGSSSDTGDIELVDILCSDQLASCPVLVTTRPWRAVEIRSDGDLMKLYTFIHVEGFNRENLSVYIHKYFPKNDDQANQLIQFTSENDVISENMPPYPIYVAMLCLMWKELMWKQLKEMKSLKTFSQIFKRMIAFLKEHYAQKEVKKVGSPSLIAYMKQIDELLGPIAKQALNCLLENTLVFGEDDFEICPESKDTACRVGILSQEDRITTDLNTHQRNSHVQLLVFFPQRQFQEYMAGVHLASLYESNRNEFHRLMEQVVLPRKEVFRYLLYFTVSQNKSIATHVINSMLHELHMNRGGSQEQIDFIVDVAFESQDPDVAALVKDSISSKAITLTISRYTSAHTVAGYAIIGPHVVQTLKLDDVQCPTPASSHHLAEALCSMPNLTDLTLLGGDLNEEFYSTLKANASFIQVQTLKLDDVQCPTPASSHQLAEALCSMPNLTYLTLLGGDLNEKFCSTLKANASSIQGCFPQIRMGNFRFNGAAHNDLKSFLHNLTHLQSPVSDCTSDSDGSGNSNDSDISAVPRPQPMGAVHSSRRALPPSDYPQQQPMGDVHYPIKILLPSDQPQQHVGNTSDTVCQFSQTHREGSSSQCRPYKRQAPSTQSRVPHDDPELQEKQSNQESRWLRLDETDDGNQVHWDILTDIPQELTLQDDEAVISCGIRFSPSGAPLSKPIKVTLDHNAHFSNPRRAEIFFYTRNKDSKSFERIPASTSGYPCCNVRAKDLDLYVYDFSDWWIVAVRTRYFVGKRVNCRLYVLPPVRKEFSHCVYLCIFDDLLDVIQKIKDEMKEYTQLHPPQQMFVEWKCGDININLFDGPKGNEKEIDEKRLGTSDIYRLDRNRCTFEVKPLESGASQKLLKFTLNQKESLFDPTLIQFILLYDDMETTTTAAIFPSVHAGSQAAAAAIFPPMHASAQAAGVSMLLQIDLESDGILDTLSKHIPPRSYITLCRHLGIEYTKADDFLTSFNMDYQRAARHCLAQWKTRTGGNMAQLKAILMAAEVGDLVKYIM